jgi:tetratricopeptide (TPR) repeat protein
LESLYYGRGLYLKRRDFEKATADFSAAIEIDQAHHDAYCERGTARIEQRDYEAAQADFTRAIELKPESWRGYWGRATARYESTAYGDAVTDYDAAIARDPGTRAIFYNRAIVYERLKDAARMVADAERYLAAAPEPASVVEQDCRAFALFMVGKPEAGLLDVEKVLAEEPQNANALGTRGRILEALGRREQAVADFRKALTLDPRPLLRMEAQEALRRLGAEA